MKCVNSETSKALAASAQATVGNGESNKTEVASVLAKVAKVVIAAMQIGSALMANVVREDPATARAVIGAVVTVVRAASDSTASIPSTDITGVNGDVLPGCGISRAARIM